MDITVAEKLAHELIARHGLDEHGWQFCWDNTKNRLGICRYRQRIIGLSKPLALVNDEDEVRDTILHEIAHALAGPLAKHGPEWKRVARAIGARPRSSSVTAKPVPALWQGLCPTEGCDFIGQRHRLTDKSRRVACPECCNRFNGGRWAAQFMLQWVKGANREHLAGVAV